MNLGTIVFLVIVIYLTAYVINYLGKEKLAIYEVSKSDISDSVQGTGIILREEKLVKTREQGYINYYVKDGSRVKNGGTVYTVDTTGKLQSYLNELLQKKNSVTTEEKQQIFEELKSFSDSFSHNHFSEVYETKKEINHELMSYTDTIIADNQDALEERYGQGSYVEVAAEDTGLVSFSSDGLEELDEAGVSLHRFEQRAKMKDLRSKEEKKAGSAVYRIVTGQNWELMIPVNEADYARMKNLKKKGRNTVQVTFYKDNFQTRATFECQKQKKENYLVLYFENYVQRYIDQRYLSVELLLSETEGLKIPSSSLVEKEVYKIPSDYLTAGSNSGTKNQVNVLSKNKKGEEVLTQARVKVYKTEGNNVLLTSEDLKKGDRLSDLEKAKTYTLKATSQLQGVYIVNRGYAVFEPVTILERTEDYCIISAEDGEVQLYDRVILNSGTIKENQVIY